MGATLYWIAALNRKPDLFPPWLENKNKNRQLSLDLQLKCCPCSSQSSLPKIKQHNKVKRWKLVVQLRHSTSLCKTEEQICLVLTLLIQHPFCAWKRFSNADLQLTNGWSRINKVPGRKEKMKVPSMNLQSGSDGGIRYGLDLKEDFCKCYLSLPVKVGRLPHQSLPRELACFTF